MGRRDDRLGELKEQRADLERLRESGLGDRDALKQKLDDLDDDIEHAERDIERDEDAAREDARDETRPADTSGATPDAPARDSGPLDIDKVHNFETFPEVPDREPEAPRDEPINAWELDGAGREGDGGDQLRSDSVIPDLGWKAPKGPLSDEAEAEIDGAHERLPSLVGERAGTMGGGLFDGETGVVPPPPSMRIDSRPSIGRGSRTLISVPIAVILGLLTFLGASRIGVADVAGTSSAPTVTATAAAPAATAARSAAAAGYRCVGDQKPLFDNSNGGVANNGATGGAKFGTNGKTYCLVSMRTYHWNSGKGAAPGKVGLVGGAGDVGPFQAQGTAGQGGAPNVNWIYVPDPAERQLLQGDYSCYDSDPATWSQNDQSGHAGFCAVYVQDAVKQ